MIGKMLFVFGFLAFACGVLVLVFGLAGNGGTDPSFEKESRALRAKVTDLNSELGVLRLENERLKATIESNSDLVTELANRLKEMTTAASNPGGKKPTDLANESSMEGELVFRSGNLEIDLLAAEFDWKGLAEVLVLFGNESDSMRRSPKVMQLMGKLIGLMGKIQEVCGKEFESHPVLVANGVAAVMAALGVDLTESQKKEIATLCDDFDKKIFEHVKAREGNYALDNIRNSLELNREFNGAIKGMLTEEQISTVKNVTGSGASTWLRHAERLRWPDDRSYKVTGTDGAVDRITDRWKNKLGFDDDQEPGLREVVRHYVNSTQDLKDHYGVGGVDKLSHEKSVQLQLELAGKQVEALKSLSQIGGLTEKQRSDIKEYDSFDTYRIDTK